MLSFYDFIQVYVFTTNHHLKFYFIKVINTKIFRHIHMYQYTDAS